MTTRLLILLAAALLCCAVPVQGQTIKSLGYNSTNGRIVAATNVVWTNAFNFSTNTVAAQVRTNLGLGATNTVTFGIINANAVSVGGANFEETGIISGGGFYIADQNTTNTNAVFYFDGDATDRLRANARTNLGLGATWLTNTNSPIFPDSNGRLVAPVTIYDSVNDTALLTLPSDSSSTVDPIVMNVHSGAWNTSNNRTALGLGLPALTNTSNVTTMRALAGSTNTNQPFSGSISVVGTNNTNTLVFSNGILLSQ